MMQRQESGFSGILILLLIILIAVIGLVAWRVAGLSKYEPKAINSFADCVAAGNPVMESYPEQCAADGQTFTNPSQSLQNETSGYDDCVAAGNVKTEEDGYLYCTMPDGQRYEQPTPEKQKALDEANKIADEQKVNQEKNPWVEQDFLSVPSSLRQAVYAHNKAVCPSEPTPTDANYNGIKGSYLFVSNTFAVVPVGCSSDGAAGLFALKSGSWQFVESTQSQYTCSKLSEFAVPYTVIYSCGNGTTLLRNMNGR